MPIKNRSKDTKRSDDKIKDFNLELFDIDFGIRYYFENIIKPQIQINDRTISVPIIYGTPDRWKSTRKDGFFRAGRTNKIQLPLIMYRRTNISNLREYPRHLDANNPELFVTHYTKYTAHNKYDQWSRLNQVKKQKEFHNVIIPKYIQLSYECLIWTRNVIDMNKIQEVINYAESAYWGDPQKFRFLATIDSFDKTIDIAEQEERAVRSNFNIEMKGFIVSKNIQQQLAQSSEKTFNATKIILSEKDYNTNEDL